MLSTSTLQKTVFFLIFFFLIVAILHFFKPFLVPVCFGWLLAMLFLPASRWIQRSGIPKALAILLCILFLVSVIAGIIWLLSWQVTDLTGDLSNIEQKINKMISDLKQYINNHFGISAQQQDELLNNQKESGANIASRIGSGMMSFLVDFILVLVYIFLFMYYSTHIKNFILQLVPAAQKENAHKIIADIQKVAQSYISGLGMMIVCLWIMYSIGFSIIGVRYPVFFAITCGLLEIVPFVGNLTGNLLTILMVIIQGGGTGMIIGVIITYAIVQFLQTYILEPLVVGSRVHINPLFVILVLVAGELVWGIAGLVLAIPLLAIVKIICDHIESLKPYGFLMGQQKKPRQSLIGKKKNPL